MSIIGLVVLLVILGLIFYCVQLIPMAAPFPTIIKVVAVIVAILVLLQFLGVTTGVPPLGI